jgi:hypothetical protein
LSQCASVNKQSFLHDIPRKHRNLAGRAYIIGEFFIKGFYLHSLKEIFILGPDPSD